MSTSNKVPRSYRSWALSGLCGLGAIALLGISHVASAANGAETASKSRIIIGSVQPYTGEESSYGQWADDAWKLATENFGNSVDGHPLTVVRADSKCEPSAAVSAARRVLAEHPALLLAPVCSGSTLAIMPLIKSHHLPALSDNLAPKVTAISGGWVWRVQITDSVLTPPEAKYMIGKGYKRIGVMYDTSAYGQGIGEDMVHALRDGGVAPVVVATYDPSATDYSGPLLKMKRAKLDALYVEAYEIQGARLLTQARQLGFNIPLYANFSLFDDTFIKAAGANGNGIIGVTSYTPNWSPAAKKFDEQWFAKFHYHTNADIAALYEMSVAAIKGLEREPHARGKALNKIVGDTNLTDLPLGALRFDSTGNNANPLVLLVTWKNQKLHVLKVLRGHE